MNLVLEFADLSLPCYLPKIGYDANDYTNILDI